MDGILELDALDGGTDRLAVGKLARHIVAQMAGSRRVESGPPQMDLVMMLARAARSGDPVQFRQLQIDFGRRRISGERVIDIYIPAAVAALGDAWHNDEISSLHATVAFARLQDLLRELGNACVADQVGRPDGPRVLLVIPAREQHIIGAMLAANRLRRLGVSVCIEFLAGPEEVRARMAEQSFDAVFLSVANRSTIPTCEVIIRTIRRDRPSGLPVVVGGPLATIDPDALAQFQSVIIATRMDHALVACGLLAHSEAAQ